MNHVDRSPEEAESTRLQIAEAVRGINLVQHGVVDYFGFRFPESDSPVIVSRSGSQIGEIQIMCPELAARALRRAFKST